MSIGKHLAKKPKKKTMKSKDTLLGAMQLPSSSLAFLDQALSGPALHELTHPYSDTYPAQPAPVTLAY